MQKQGALGNYLCPEMISKFTLQNSYDLQTQQRCEIET